MQTKSGKDLEEFETLNIGDTSEYAQYAVETEHTLHSMQKRLSNCPDPKKAALDIMKVAAEFYHADWCGIFVVDMEIGIWTPRWRYSGEADEAESNERNEYELSDGYMRWIACLENHDSIIIMDTEDTKEEYPKEYELYQKFGVKSVMAIPLWKGLNGFLVLRNPQRYKQYTGFLRTLNYAVVSSINEYFLLETSKLRIISPRITNDTDVYISLFGELKITTKKGVLSERELNSPKISRLLVYLLISKKIAVSPREIADTLWADEELENVVKNIKGLVYRLQQAFSLLSDYRLVESTSNGYRLNPKLNIFTDYQLFDKKWHIALKSTDSKDKIETLKKAVDLYRGTLFQSASHEHWMLPIAVAFEYRFIGAVCELMKTLHEAQDYIHIQHYASVTLRVAPHSVDAYFWMTVAMYRMNHSEMVRNELRMAQSKLLEEEFAELVSRLHECGCNCTKSFITLS